MMSTIARPNVLLSCALFEGSFQDLRWHIIDGRKLQHGGGSHQEHMRTALSGTLPKAEGTLVGFYSSSHQGVFTHMGSTTHFHAVVPKENVTGHVDHVVLEKGTRVGFPEAR